MAWRLPTHVFVEPGSLRRLGSLVRERIPAERVLLVLDPGLVTTPWPEVARAALVAAGLRVVEDTSVEPNPRTTTAERLAALAREQHCDLVVALGGGSALDAAKAAAMLATNLGSAAEFAGRERFTVAPLPFVACPTTCGTGSEVTWVSVLTDRDARRKISLKGMGMFPRLAVVDADVLATLPASLVATTGMDALTHAIEATICRLANPVSDALAEQAIRKLLDFLPALVADPAGAQEAREEVALASTLAGMAFGNADVAAVHCLSESIGGLMDLPHGLLNAVLLVPTLRVQLGVVGDRLGALERALGGAESNGEALLARLERLGAAVGIPAPRSLAIPAELDEEIATASVANGSNSSNRMAFDHSTYRALLTGFRATSSAAR